MYCIYFTQGNRANFAYLLEGRKRSLRAPVIVDVMDWMDSEDGRRHQLGNTKETKAQSQGICHGMMTSSQREKPGGGELSEDEEVTGFNE